MKSRRREHGFTEHGFTLVETLICVAIMGVFVMAMVSNQSIQGRENQALGEKLAALDLQRAITQALVSPAVCSLLFTPANVANVKDLTFDATSLSPTKPYLLNLKQIPSGVPQAPLATDGGLVSVLSSSLFLSSAQSAGPGVQFKVTSLTPPTGFLAVNFDLTKTVRPIHGLVFPIAFATSGPLSATKLTGCQTAGAALSDWECISPLCIRTSDGTLCTQTSATSPWKCQALTGWPGPGDWKCSGMVGAFGLACVRVSDGTSCTPVSSGSVGPWVCRAGSGWPQ